MKIICSDLYSQTLPKSGPSFSFGVHKHIYIYIYIYRGIINWRGIGYYKLKRHVVFKRTNCFLWNHLCWLTENLVFASISQLEKEASVTATNWSVTHWHWRMYLRGEGNWHTVRLLRGKQALDWRLERISVRHSVPARLRVQKWVLVTEGLPLSSVSHHTVWAVFGPKVPGESFIWVAATCYHLRERTCKCILLRL